MQREDVAQYSLPDAPGVYFFRERPYDASDGVILYIGKAASLRDRVRSYFAHDLAETRSTAIATMVTRANHLTWEQTDSVLEALILEANLIKKHQPPYNSDEKDNKSFNYLVLTREKFPRVLVVRGRELFQKWRDEDIGKLFGPYPQGGALKEALKLVRKIFPYRDSCTPCEPDSSTQCKPCFNAQLGLCPGVCAGTMDAAGYKEVIRNITELFSGRMRSLRQRLEREMKRAAREEEFERATVLRRQVAALTHIRDVSLIKDESRYAGGGSIRIEAYDVAHTSGTETVGVMTVVSGGEAQKDAYRKFKIQTATNNDVAALTEVLERRFAHPEWNLPRLIVIDGSTAQMRAARRVLEKAGVQIPLIGVVKDEHHRPERFIGDEHLVRAHEKDILLANAEAHRFAITWHRARRARF